MKIQFAQKALIHRDGMVLLVRKGSDDPHNPGRWELPGGRLKREESLDEALVREVHEEVGLDVEPGRPLAIWSWRLGDAEDAPTVVAVARLCSLRGGDISLDFHDVGDFIDGFNWFTPQQVMELDLIPSAREPIRESLANL